MFCVGSEDCLDEKKFEDVLIPIFVTAIVVKNKIAAASTIPAVIFRIRFMSFDLH